MKPKKPNRKQELYDFIESLLTGQGYSPVFQGRIDFAISSEEKGVKYYTVDYQTGFTVEGQNLIARFVIYNGDVDYLSEGVAIYARWQGVSGGVDRKLPTLVYEMNTFTKLQSILVLEGGGYSRKSFENVKSRVGVGNFKLLFNKKSFQDWVDDGNLVS